MGEFFHSFLPVLFSKILHGKGYLSILYPFHLYPDLLPDRKYLVKAVYPFFRNLGNMKKSGKSVRKIYEGSVILDRGYLAKKHLPGLNLLHFFCLFLRCLFL